MKRLIIYIHGKGGNAEEANHYRSLFPGSDVIGFDYISQNPWDARDEFSAFYDSYSKGYDEVILIANSIGAFFTMSALSEKNISKALFISPIVNMEKLITDMMRWSKVTEDELQSKKEISTEFGEILSWKYLCYVREHRIEWHVPTCILYGGKDNLTSGETISEFADRIGAVLTVMEDGEHWFHTKEQMQFLDDWVHNSLE
ncbi:MAG: alpha/beta hydrolase [Clostridiales bacterium]|nr:alpha/beta hydrolase [Clostridiales bacterium]